MYQKTLFILITLFSMLLASPSLAVQEGPCDYVAGHPFESCSDYGELMVCELQRTDCVETWIIHDPQNSQCRYELLSTNCTKS